MGSGMVSEELPGWDIRVRVQITTVMDSGKASEEFPGWDVIVSDHAFLGRNKLVELVLISTNIWVWLYMRQQYMKILDHFRLHHKPLYQWNQTKHLDKESNKTQPTIPWKSLTN